MSASLRSDDSTSGGSWPSDRKEKDLSSPGGRRARGSRSSHAKPGPSMRNALVVSGVLGGVMVLAIALVAVMVVRNSPSRPPQSAGFTMATRGASGKASPSATASTSAKAKKSAKPTTSPKAKKSAKKPATSSAHTAVPSSALTVPAGWKLTFDPSFSGSALDTGTWATCYDWAKTDGCTNNPAEEKEWYLSSQVKASGGVLNLVAQREPTQGVSSSGAPETYSCRSGMVTSKPGFNFTYGLIQVTAKLPYGPGLWPALWLAATNDQWPPELDIMEHWYSEQDYKIYDHTIGTHYVGGPVPTPVNLSTGFHTFSMLWTKSRVTWYLDGVQKFTTTDHVPQQAMYFIANVADRNPDGDNSSSIASDACNGTMQISSVKVWQP
ncbi:MAG: glycoside hydrolase family 16 protein [Trebonia sp.]